MRPFGIVLLLGVLTIDLVAHDPITTRVTFSREVRAILAARCVTCHAPGGSAPMPFTTYDETRPWARAIKEQVLTRRMPRWHAARGFGSFANDPTLTPFEIALLVSWIDGGLPRDERALPGASAAAAPPVAPAAIAPLTRPVDSAFRRKATFAIALPAGTTQGSRPIGSTWIVGWDFQPGDPLIASATFSLADGTPVGNWVAGDRAVTLPPDSGIRVSGRLRVELHRRPKADYEHEYRPRPSVLRVATRAQKPRYRMWTERGECAAIAGVRRAQLFAIRPELAANASAQIALERVGAAPIVVGWFRDYDPSYARTYWLRRPLEFGPDARLTSDGACSAAVVLRARR